ncbi:hypothetical protein ATE48_10535 [Candidatus Viadribacter manganicus]|uniref:Tat pathway signal protein n=1 Tax=Candidatus Viadribacter manganicus TaxID=1759059 RepID=A0A1B1AIF5_9PROT|nr:hypothetical protein ATE48_10535 [Candidatus Viadribacter manganicus]
MSATFNAVLDRSVANSLRRSPERCTSLGLTEERAGYRFIDKVSDASKAAAREARALQQTSLNELRAINRDALTPRDRVTYDVVETAWVNSLDSSAFEVGGGAGSPYVVTQLTGAYRSMPNFLNEQHPLRSVDEADGYLARIDGFVGQLDAETAIIAEDAAAGVIPPDFAIDKAVLQLGRFAEGAPNQNILVQSLVRRLPDVQAIPEASRAGYMSRAEAAVRERVIPAVQRQIAALQRVRPQAVHDAGIWRLPQGAEMYAVALRSRTTTNMSPDEIHNVGLELIAQFNSEMAAILRAEGMTRGSVAQRVQELSRRPDQLYPNTDAGREQILTDLNAQTREIEAMMPRAFNTLARAQLEIRRVPPFTEAGAPGGYYQRAALDGSRPGAYFINLRDTGEWPRFTLPTLNYHEGVPGHHWQISIQQESGSIPFIRSAMLGFSAFSEGWGLYAEQLADELGAYANNRLGRLGYLQSATFRASRLVCDTGLHHKRWTREQAIQSMMEATGDLESSVTTEIERYCVNPGQACAYMIGRQAINRIRQQATTTLGPRFDLKTFHDTMLANGAVPLSVLERVLHDWAAAQG